MKKLYIVLLIAMSIHGAGNFTVKIVDNANNPQIKNLYVVVKGTNPRTRKQCFVKFNPGSGSVGTLVDITKTTRSQNYAVSYNTFKNNTMHLPNLISGRIYLSLNRKLVMPIVGKAPNLGIADPSPYNKSDPNFQTLYDKVEFTYTGNTTVINPTAVDYIALPIAISQNNKTYGMTKARSAIFGAIQNTFNKVPSKAAWNKLIEKNSKGTILRILAAGRDPNYFDSNYLNGKTYNYISDVWNYYKTKTIVIDCTELKNIPPKLSGYMYTGKVVGSKFVFTNGNKAQDVTLDRPTSDQFFLASQGTFNAKNGTPRAVIVRNFTAAWSVGLLPVADKTVLSKKYFADNKSKFYTPNSYLSPKSKQGGPWYNLYAKAIHKQSKNDYAWPYDDILGLDGTNTSSDKNPATLTLGTMAKTKVPASRKLLARPVRKKLDKKAAKKKTPTKKKVNKKTVKKKVK